MKPDKRNDSTPTRRDVIAGLTLGLGAAAVAGAGNRAHAAEEIARTMESIHQEVQFKASPERLYAALTDAKQFQKVVLLSGAVKKGMVKAPPPAQISAVVGGEFAVFGGYISGRQIELVPNVRIVQACALASSFAEEPSRYSVAEVGAWLLGNHLEGNRAACCPAS